MTEQAKHFLVMWLRALLLLCTPIAKAEKPVCRLRGIPEFPLLSKEGDVTIGGAFSIHSKITQPGLTFTERPKPLLCSRFVTSGMI